MVNRVVVAGPWGGEGGGGWSYQPKGKISRIVISYDKVIHTISFTGKDKDGKVDNSIVFGTREALQDAKIEIDVMKGEKLKGISGTIDDHEGVLQVVTSLSFTTDNDKSYGPFGTVIGTAFSLVVDEDHDFSGFYGRAGWYIDAIGVYIHTNKTSIRFAQWGNTGGAWIYQPKDPISRITITYDNAITSLTFTSKDGNGKEYRSKLFGRDVGTRNEIYIDVKNEKLNYISGTYARHIKYTAYLVVTSLSFSTNRNKVHGPFGRVYGTTFSLPIKDSVISGFHGRTGGWLDGIGVYVSPN